jgi:hypothetical protein
MSSEPKLPKAPAPVVSGVACGSPSRLYAHRHGSNGSPNCLRNSLCFLVAASIFCSSEDCLHLSISQRGGALLPPCFDGRDRGQRFQSEYLSIHQNGHCGRRNGSRCAPRPPMPRSTLRNTPRDVSRKTRGQDGVAFSFPVGLLHPLQHAGLSRRTTRNAQPVLLKNSTRSRPQGRNADYSLKWISAAKCAQ